MIRRGEYTRINNKEYRVIIRDRKGKSYLVTDELEKGFCRHSEGVYEKEIKLESLNNLYYIHPIAKYKNGYFNVRTFIKKGKICIGTNDATTAKKYEMDRTDKYYYEKWVSLDEVEMIEERKEMELK